jgi:hypothetical protein
VRVFRLCQASGRLTDCVQVRRARGRLCGRRARAPRAAINAQIVARSRPAPPCPTLRAVPHPPTPPAGDRPGHPQLCAVPEAPPGARARAARRRRDRGARPRRRHLGRRNARRRDRRVRELSAGRAPAERCLSASQRAGSAPARRGSGPLPLPPGRLPGPPACPLARAPARCTCRGLPRRACHGPLPEPGRTPYEPPTPRPPFSRAQGMKTSVAPRTAGRQAPIGYHPSGGRAPPAAPPA